jgi:hypothetical protein
VEEVRSHLRYSWPLAVDSMPTFRAAALIAGLPNGRGPGTWFRPTRTGAQRSRGPFLARSIRFRNAVAEFTPIWRNPRDYCALHIPLSDPITAFRF